MWNPFRKNIGQQLSKRFTTARVRPKPPRQVSVRSVKDPETDKLLQKWDSRARPFVATTDLHQTKLVGRARDICFNNQYGKAGLRVLRQNIVGENGIRFQSGVMHKSGELDMDTNHVIEEAWREFSKMINIDVAGRKNMLGIQTLALNSLITDGEFFYRKHKDGMYGIQLQEIDALRIPPSATNRYRLESEGQLYKNGVIVDKKKDKPIYYMLNRDKINYYDLQPDRFSELVPASEVIHGFQQEAAGQMRGVPLGQTSSETLYMIAKYSEAALQNARVGAAKVGFFTQNSDQPMPTRIKTDENGDPVMDSDGNPVLENVMDNVKLDLKAGTASALPPGVDFSAWSPEYPNNEFEEFIKVMLRGASVGFSIPYSDISGDLSDVNYSSMRQGALEIRANYRILQGVLILYLMDPLFRDWLIEVLMTEMLSVNGRKLTMDMFHQLHKPIWTPKRWAWIDPRAEAIANQIAIKQGLKSPSQIIKEMGGDPEEVWKSVKQDIEVMKGMGLPEEFVYGIFAHQPATVQDLIGEIYASSGDTINDMSNQV